jgi:Ca-activated chloride channel homolog
LRDGDRLSVVSFASDVVTHIDAAVISPETRVRIAAEIARLRTRGQTNLSGGWFAAVDCAATAAEADPALVPRVILLSDGHANQGITDRAELCEHARELARRGVLTSALGIGDGYDEQLLRGIAEHGDGRLHDAELTEEIESVLLGELEDIATTVIERATVELRVPDGLQLSRIGRDHDSGETDGRRIFSLGAIQDGIERTMVFRIRCPALPPGERLPIEALVRGKAEDGSRLLAEALPVTLVSGIGRDNNAQRRDETLALIVARTWSAEIVAKVARLNREGDRREARRFIERALRYFERYAEGLPDGGSLIHELRSLARRAEQELSPRMAKEMTFQSIREAESRIDRRGDKMRWSDRLEQGD